MDGIKRTIYGNTVWLKIAIMASMRKGRVPRRLSTVRRSHAFSLLLPTYESISRCSFGWADSIFLVNSIFPSISYLPAFGTVLFSSQSIRSHIISQSNPDIHKASIIISESSLTGSFSVAESSRVIRQNGDVAGPIKIRPQKGV